MNRQAIEIYFAQVRDALQRLEFGYYHRQMFESGKRRIGGIAHVELVDRASPVTRISGALAALTKCTCNREENVPCGSFNGSFLGT